MGLGDFGQQPVPKILNEYILSRIDSKAYAEWIGGGLGPALARDPESEKDRIFKRL